MSALTPTERALLADAVDAGRDFTDAWVRAIRNGNENMLLPVVRDIIAARISAERERILTTPRLPLLADEIECCASGSCEVCRR